MAANFPGDWPGEGPIDLATHDLPHRSSSTEWWYVNTHAETVDGRKLSLFAAFFRLAVGRDEVTKEPIYAHSITWALSEADGKRYTQASLVDKKSPELALERVNSGEGTRDERIRRAMREVLKRRHVPLPDRLFTGDVYVATSGRLSLDFDGNTLTRLDDGSYALSLWDERQKVGAKLVLKPRKPPARHGDNGVVKSVGGEDMFYYFIPRCDVTGTVSLNGTEVALARGQGWYDHEFGLYLSEQKKKRSIGWNWLSVQLDDGSEASVFALTDRETKESAGNWAVVIAPDGSFKSAPSLKFTAEQKWRSTRTFFEYPVKWALEVPDAGLSLTIEAEFSDQEFLTMISKAAFWEGRVKVKGTCGNRAVTGLGFIEISGGQQIDDLDGFFGAVGLEVRKSVEFMLPLHPTFNEVQDLIAGADRPTFMEGVDLDQFARTISAPIREITDRGGKSWRSYAGLACCDAVGGDSRKFVTWLAMPEFLHVGSLIVDDVQDRSTIRRGKPAAHLIYGDAIAINAGTASYFLGQRLLKGSTVSNADRLRLYDLYFEALRAGHAGQAFDIDGLTSIMPHVVDTGDGAMAQKRVMAIHRLKTAVPAATMARMGAVAGGGSEAQIEGLGTYFEAVGLAFQIIDDVLNLKGFKGDLKSKGEDISCGKVTMPVAKAMSLLPVQERRWLWDTISSKPKDPGVIGDVIARIDSCGALAACETESSAMVEKAWMALDPLIEDSLPKLMLRAFGWYVLERYY